MRVVIGLIGRIASGKSIVADYLVREKHASYYRFSDVLRDLLLRLHKPNTRANLQELGLALRRVFGDGILAEALKVDIEAEEAELIIVDGIRYEDEFRMVKEIGGILVYITAPQEMRYQRVVNRASRGEAGISIEDFKRNEARQTEELIDTLGAKADHKIDNTGTIEELKKKVDEILNAKT
ncbi:MAG: AAA family ATPase [Candidatus Altiarchaeota archaeon]